MFFFVCSCFGFVDFFCRFKRLRMVLRCSVASFIGAMDCRGRRANLSCYSLPPSFHLQLTIPPTNHSPTNHPPNQPSPQPTILPTNHPPNQPSPQPTILQPTILLTNHPPTNHPPNQPSSRPIILPTNHPPNQPSSQPTIPQPTILQPTIPLKQLPKHFLHNAPATFLFHSSNHFFLPSISSHPFPPSFPCPNHPPPPFQASLSFSGATMGPSLGMFLLGGLFPFANYKVGREVG